MSKLDKKGGRIIFLFVLFALSQVISTLVLAPQDSTTRGSKNQKAAELESKVPRPQILNRSVDLNTRIKSKKKSRKLIYLINIFRHGSRSPTQNSSMIVDNMFDDLLKGRLTLLGQAQMNILGYNIRQSYKSFLQNLKEDEVMMISEMRTRNINSAKLYYSGLFQSFQMFPQQLNLTCKKLVPFSVETQDWMTDLLKFRSSNSHNPFNVNEDLNSTAPITFFLTDDSMTTRKNCAIIMKSHKAHLNQLEPSKMKTYEQFFEFMKKWSDCGIPAAEKVSRKLDKETLSKIDESCKRQLEGDNITKFVGFKKYASYCQSVNFSSGSVIQCPQDDRFKELIEIIYEFDHFGARSFEESYITVKTTIDLMIQQLKAVLEPSKEPYKKKILSISCSDVLITPLMIALGLPDDQNCYYDQMREAKIKCKVRRPQFASSFKIELLRETSWVSDNSKTNKSLSARNERPKKIKKEKVFVKAFLEKVEMDLCQLVIEGKNIRRMTQKERMQRKQSGKKCMASQFMKFLKVLSKQAYKDYKCDSNLEDDFFKKRKLFQYQTKYQQKPGIKSLLPASKGKAKAQKSFSQMINEKFVKSDIKNSKHQCILEQIKSQ